MTYKASKQAIEKNVGQYIASIEKKILSEFKAQQAQVLSVVQKNYAKYLVDVPKADYYTTLSLYNRMSEMEKEIKAIYVKLNSRVYKSTYAGQKKIFEQVYLQNEYITSFFASIKAQAPNPLITEISVTGDVELVKKIKDKALRQQAQGYISKSGSTLTGIITTNNQASLAKVYKTLKQGFISGQSYVKQATAIKSEFGKNAYNALRVARTEGNRNASAGAYTNSEDLKAQGIKTKRQWVATLDSDTRDTHQQLDGQFEDKDGLFHINGMSARYPGDFPDPTEVINCRCTTIDIIDGVEPELRRGIDPVTGKSDILSFQNYAEWANKVQKL